jgi:hypothetical protein
MTEEKPTHDVDYADPEETKEVKVRINFVVRVTNHCIV